MAELECQLESGHRESQDWAAKAIVARVEGQRVVERATAAKRGLEAVKAH